MTTGELHPSLSVGEQLIQEQHAQLQNMLEEFSDVFQDRPGRTNLVEHSISTGSAQPVRLPPYRLPHATVKKEIEEMLQSGITEPATGISWVLQTFHPRLCLHGRTSKRSHLTHISYLDNHMQQCIQQVKRASV